MRIKQVLNETIRRYKLLIMFAMQVWKGQLSFSEYKDALRKYVFMLEE